MTPHTMQQQRYVRLWAALLVTLLLLGHGRHQVMAAGDHGSLYRDLFPRPMRFEQLGMEEGLSHSTVTYILQDSHGYLWFATEDGLNRYDGYTFTVYKHDPDDPHSLSNNATLGLLEDRSGVLWVATYGGGLNRFERETETFTHYRHDPHDEASLSSDYVVRVYQDRAGVFWLTTEGGGLNRFEPETETFTAYRHDPLEPGTISSDIVTRVLEDRYGVFWVGTEGGGLNRFDRETETFTTYRHDPHNEGSLSHDVVWSLIEDRDGVLWVGTFGGGLNRYDRQTDSFSQYRHDPNVAGSLSSDDVRFVYEDHEGVLWVGTVGAGLNQFDRDRGTFTVIRAAPGEKLHLQSDLTWCMAEDRAGILWIGTAGQGVQKYARGQENFTYVPAQPEKTTALNGTGVTALFEDSEERLWVAAWDGGLNRLDPLSGQFFRYLHNPDDPQSLSHNVPGPLAQDADGILWVGTFGAGLNGLDLSLAANLDPDTAHFQQFRHDANDAGSLSGDIVQDLLVAADGTLWVGTTNGLDARRAGADHFMHYRHDPQDEGSISNNVIRTVFADEAGTLWVGTDVGLNRLDHGGDSFTHYVHDPGDPASLSANVIFALYQDGAGFLWIGTWGGGLNKFDPRTEQFTRYTEKDGLPNDTVTTIVPDEAGRLWLSTNRGVARFNPATETFVTFDEGDGLRGLETGTMIAAHTGELLVADQSGFTIFDPVALADSRALAPPLVISLLSQGGEALSPAPAADGLSAVTIRWPQNFFEFEYAALDFVRPEHNEYAYMLEGFDDAWNEMGTRRFGRYTNLPGGDYVLRVRGANSEGVWNEEGIALRVTVVPPFWATPWFRALAVFLLVGAVGAAYQVRVHNIRARNRELAQLVGERTERLTALYTITAVVSSALNLRETLTTALDKTLEVLALDAGAIYLLEGDEPTLTLALEQGFSTLCQPPAAIPDATAGPLAAALNADNLYLLSSPVEGPFAALQGCRYEWLAFTPLLSRGIVVGTLLTANRSVPDPRTHIDELLLSVGAQIGVAVENARLFEAEYRRAEQFRLIGDVSRRFSSTLEIEEVLVQVARLIQDTFGYYHVGVGLVEGDEVVYRVGAGALWDDPAFAFKPARLRVGVEGISGWVAAHGRPLRIPDVHREPRYVWMEGSRARSEMVLPITTKGEVIGVLDVQSDVPNAFDETDEAVLQALANQAGAAIENARLYEQAQQLAVMEERSRLARDLHDSVTQSIYSLTLLAEAGRRLIAANDTASVAANQMRIGDIAQQALQEMRLLVYQLRPVELETRGLVGALEKRLELVERRAGIEARLTVAGAHDPGDEAQIPVSLAGELYRIAQEALNNALKHAYADAVTVSLDVEDGQICLVISDDGRGFEPLAVGDRGGLGLTNMKQRAAAIGGSLTISAAPGTGTTVRVVAPCRRHAAAATTAPQEEIS